MDTSPSFVFYCYNDELTTVENVIAKKTNYDKIIQNIRSTKILYFLLNHNGIPKKVVCCVVSECSDEAAADVALLLAGGEKGE